MEPRQEYREAIIEIGRSGYTVISSDYRRSLDLSVKRLNLSQKDAAVIEDEVLSAFNQFEKELVEQGLKKYPFDDPAKQYINNLRKILGLTSNDTSKVEARVQKFLESVGNGKFSQGAGMLVFLGGGLGALLTANPIGLAVAVSGWAAMASGSAMQGDYETYMNDQYGKDWKQ